MGAIPADTKRDRKFEGTFLPKRLPVFRDVLISEESYVGG